MATLYESASQLRKISLGIAFGVFLILVFNSIVDFAGGGAPPNVGPPVRFYMNPIQTFGQIPPAEIPSLDFNEDAGYLLDGTHLRSFPDVAYVYSIEQPRETAFSLPNALTAVEVLGYDAESPDLQTGSIYEWLGDGGATKLVYDSKNRTWNISTDFQASTDAITSFVGVNDISNYQDRFSRLLDDLLFTNYDGMEDGILRGSFLEVADDGTFERTFLPTDAKYAELNYYRNVRLADLKPRSSRPPVPEGEEEPEEVDAIVYRTEPNEGQLNMLVSNNLQDPARDIFEMEFTETSFSETGAYLLINPNEAWTQVQQGQGSLVHIEIPGLSSSEVLATDSFEIDRFVADPLLTELAYWESDEWNPVATFSRGTSEINVDIVYPIYVFRGFAELANGQVADFTIFIDAIKRIT